MKLPFLKSNDDYDDLSDEALEAEGYVTKSIKKVKGSAPEEIHISGRDFIDVDPIEVGSEDILTDESPTKGIQTIKDAEDDYTYTYELVEVNDEDDEEYVYVTPHYTLNAIMITLLFMLIGALGVFFITRGTLTAAIRQEYLNQGYIQTIGVTATINDIREGTSAYVNGQLVEGNFVPLDTSNATATAKDVLQGFTFYANGEKITGSIPTFTPNALYKPGTTNTTIPKGHYIVGNIVIQGDPSLRPENIKKGVKIFDVTGTYEP